MTSYSSLSTQAPSTRPPSSASSRGSVHDWPLGAHDGATGWPPRPPSHEGSSGAVVGSEFRGDGAQAPVDDFDNDDRQLRRLQRIVRQRLRHARETTPYGTISNGLGLHSNGLGLHSNGLGLHSNALGLHLSRDDEDEGRPSSSARRSSLATESSAAAAVAQVQRVFRSPLIACFIYSASPPADGH